MIKEVVKSEGGEDVVVLTPETDEDLKALYAMADAGKLDPRASFGDKLPPVKLPTRDRAYIAADRKKRLLKR